MVSVDVVDNISSQLQELSISPNTDNVGTSQISETVDTTEFSDLWNSLSPDIQDLIFAFLPLADLFQILKVFRSFRGVIKRGAFQQARARLHTSEGVLSPLVFYVENALWRVTGFDSNAKTWVKLPPFTDISAPDPDLFKDFLVAGRLGLFCVNVGRASEAEKLYVCNPFTRETFQLPPLKFSRHPVVLNLHVTPTKKAEVLTSSFRVIAIGSAAIATESLSRKTEVYDSIEGEWKTVGDVPGTDFSLNDYQTGVYCESQNLLLCVGFIFNGSKGLLAFDLAKGKWRENWECTLPRDTETALTVFFAIAQLVECSGVVYLFSEQEYHEGVVFHCIDRLEFSSDGTFLWKRKLKRPRQRNRALLVYPEFTCVPMLENKLCIFNTVERTGVVYDMSEDSVNSFVRVDPDVYETLSGPPGIENGAMFHSLNPIGYAFEPNFWVSVPESDADVEEDSQGEKE